MLDMGDRMIRSFLGMLCPLTIIGILTFVWMLERTWGRKAEKNKRNLDEFDID